jgi:hypothetical protein
MTEPMAHGLSIAARVLLALALGLGLCAPIGSAAAATQIYKCFDKNLGLLYTDVPCKDGEAMTIRSGDADPAAVARLERARDALDQAATQRIVDQRRAAAQQDLAAWYGGPDPRGAYADVAPDMGYAPYDYGAPWFFSGSARPHPLRSRPPRALQSRHIALKPAPMTHLR